jgi:dihydrolipoamide dehydrogenase
MAQTTDSTVSHDAQTDEVRTDDTRTEDTRTYDVVVIGAGAVGENVAQYATEGTDLTAVLVEHELVGGECSYYACVPSKALLRPVEVTATAASVSGVRPGPLDVDAVLARRDEWVSGYDDAGQVSWAESEGIDVVRGRGRLVAERTVRVQGDTGIVTIHARHAVVIATGSVPTVPDLYAAALPWGSRDATGVRDVPERLVVVGGGVVACEAATWMAGLGSNVTMLVRGDRLLAQQEELASTSVLEGLTAAGCEVRLGATVTTCTRPDAENTGLGRIHGGPVTLTLSDGSEVAADELLVATGRRPNLADVGLADVGLSPDHVLDGGPLPPWLHVVGDAGGEAPTTHWGKYRARVLGARIAAQATSATAPTEQDHVPVPQVVFTDPQVASVGQTERAARGAGLDVVVSEVAADAVTGMTLLRDAPVGGARLVVDASTGLLLGATFVGPAVAELLHAATVAIVGRVPVHVLRHAVPSYPTASELWLRLLEELPRRFREPGEQQREQG